METQTMPRPQLGFRVAIEKRSDAIDWLTITANEPSRRTSVLKRFLRLKEALLQFGELPKTWEMRGYKGISIGSARWGTRQDDDILILSGQDAATFWRIFALLSTNCSRVDLAVTVQLEKPMLNLIRMYVDWLAENGSLSQKRATEVRRLDGIGHTLYLNRRASDQMGRIYDKGAQLKLDAYVHRLWRYEVEYKKTRAQRVLSGLLDAGDEWVSGIRSTVWDWFNSRDIPPVFDRNARDGWTVGADVSGTVTSSSQKLAWLTSQVRPTVARLKSAGLEREVIAALGLD